MPLRIAIHGAAGRMGQRLVSFVSADNDLVLAAAVDAPDHPRLGEDAGFVAGVHSLGVPITDNLDTAADAAIDFSVPSAAEQFIETCRQKKIPLVVASTGLNEAQVKKIHAAAEQIPLLWSPSMSLAVNLTMKLAEVAAKSLTGAKSMWKSSSGTTASKRMRPAVRP